MGIKLNTVYLMELIRVESYIKYTINPIGKSYKNHSNKEGKNRYLIDKALEKFNGTLSRHIIRNNEHCVKSVQKWSFFWSVFSCIGTEYREILHISPYSV